MTVIRCVAFYCAIDEDGLSQMLNRQQKVNTIACQMLHGRDNRLHLKWVFYTASLLPLYI
jgi:hypothetical protein